MVERYKSLSKQVGTAYIIDCPICLEAYGILYDIKERKKLAQLKFKNCTSKDISGVVISIKAYNQLGEVIEEIKEYHYTDIKVASGEDFGSKTPIYFSGDISVEKIEVVTNKVVFEDDTVWTPKELVSFITLDSSKPLSSAIQNNELVIEYKRMVSLAAAYVPEMVGEQLWKCTCGALNMSTSCWKCHAEQKEVFDYLDLEKLEDSIHERKYEEAKATSSKDNVEDLKRAITIFKELGVYKEAETLLEECQRKIDLIEKQNQERIEEEEQKARKKARKIMVTVAIVAIIFISALFAYFKIIKPSNEYHKAVEMIEQKDFIAAYELLDSLKDYKDSELLKSSIKSDYESAVKERDRIEQIRNANEGSTIFFGSYEQDNDKSNGKEEIEWRVLQRNGNRILVISQYALECKPFDNSHKDVSWHSCSLKYWVENTFMDEAFDAEERRKIQGEAFLLSENEVIRYFHYEDSFEDRKGMCYPTEYVKAKGVYIYDAGECVWWISMPMRDDAHATVVGSAGHFSSRYADEVECVRPAIWIDISSYYSA